MDFYRPDYDVSDWDVVKVPCSWQAMGIRASGQRFGCPIYLNQAYVWAGTLAVPAQEGLWPRVTGASVPKEWTFGSNDNPVGSYRRDFSLPTEWQDKDVYIQFDGVESFFYLWVNGSYVGFSKNSRNAAVFDVTKLVKSGHNMVAVEVYRNSDGSYLEAQDLFRLAGINRHVRLYCAPKRSIADAKITTKPVVDGNYEGDWTVSAEVEYRYTGQFRDLVTDLRPGCTIRARVFDGNGLEVALHGKMAGNTLHRDNTTDWADNNFSVVKLNFNVRKPRPWSAEEPNLYTLVLELFDWNEKHLESVGFQLGFREVKIADRGRPTDRVFLFNGKPVKLKGVNRGECDPRYGHHVPDEMVLKDLQLIKRANMNHIRCSHFPQGEYFYYLCNKVGVYVMDEANLESHGYSYGDLSLSHREEWLPAHWDRVRSMYEWEKNCPCVIMWSLGNEAGPGRNFKECYENLRGRDKDGRPINWERNNSLVDIGSRQYPQIQWVRDVAAGTNTVMYPYHINEYAHDRLCCPNDLKAYQDAIESSDRIVGAAIWDWADQALWTRTSDGKKFLAFGGDFGEMPVEGEGGDGILEGLVTADRTPEPSYWEAKSVFQPYAFSLEGESVRIVSKNYFADSSSVRFEYAVLVGGRMSTPWRMLDIGSPIRPRGTRIVPLPGDAVRAGRNSDVAVRFRAVQKSEDNLVPAGWPVAEEQLLLSPSSAVVAMGAGGRLPEPFEHDGVLDIGKWRFSLKDGTLANMGMTLDAFRYPVGGELRNYVGPGPNAIYRECLREGLRTLRAENVRFERPVREGDDWVFETEQVWRGVMREDATSASEVRVKIWPLGDVTETNTAFRTVNRWRVRTDGSLDLDTSFEHLGRVLDDKARYDWAPPASWQIVPRLGWRFEFPVTGGVEYYGRGPWETYPSRKAGAFQAVWQVGTVLDMGCRYARNQDFGNRVDVRWVTICDANLTIATCQAPFQIAVSPWTASELLTNDHPEDLPTPSRTLLTVALQPDGTHSLSLKFMRRKSDSGN